MAKSTKHRGSKPMVKKGAPKKQAPARSRKAPAKAPRKAPSNAKVARKPAKAAKGKRMPATRVEKSAMPQHSASTEAARRAVARPTKAHHEAQMEKAEHDHQDPRLAGIPGTGPEASKVQVENYGQFKNKAVARLDKPTNWFRRAAKPKQ
ncbi:MAG TPA: hypothetical protein VM327_04990 [Candidatus Thermoplasmatota archaeon]|nr:hypothetical protein [Candidatus Thermoplasmatota archaeon]